VLKAVNLGIADGVQGLWWRTPFEWSPDATVPSEQGNWWIDQDAASIALDLPAKEAQLCALVAAVFPPVCRRLEAG
jgi:hypothetical protein